MPKVAHKTLTFPLGGVSRREGYREQTRPYSTPWSVNVRGVCALEHRERGGSRPGLTTIAMQTVLGAAVSALFPVSCVDSSGDLHAYLVALSGGNLFVIEGSSLSEADGRLLTDAGATITAENGEDIVFDHTASAMFVGGNFVAIEAAAFKGKLLLADADLKVFDPLSGVVQTVIASSGVVPTNQPLIALYRGRVILGGKDGMWYASRTGSWSDWDFGGEMGDPSRAIAGQCARAGLMGEPLTAIIPMNDDSLLFASARGLWMLRGDPATGGVVQLSDSVGVIAPNAWAKSSEGILAFLSHDGVYTMAGASVPQRFSENRVPESLRDVDPLTNVATMAWDARERGFHLFVTPSSGVGTHWWLDVANKAMWPVVLQEGHQPTAVARIAGESGGLHDVVLGCADGYLRKFSGEATTDDGTDIESHVLIGPLRLTTDDLSDAILTEVHGVLADNAGAVTWRIVPAVSAEEAADLAVEAVEDVLAGNEPTGVACSGTWVELRNRVDRPRVRGPWVTVWLSSTDRWAYEAIALRIAQLGRLRWA